jgi:hypothetical protein
MILDVAHRLLKPVQGARFCYSKLLFNFSVPNRPGKEQDPVPASRTSIPPFSQLRSHTPATPESQGSFPARPSIGLDGQHGWLWPWDEISNDDTAC